jgi:hypothetical protein
MTLKPLKYPHLHRDILRITNNLTGFFHSEEVSDIISIDDIGKRTNQFLGFLLSGKNEPSEFDPESLLCGLLSSRPGAEYVKPALKSLLNLHLSYGNDYNGGELLVAPLSYFHLLNALYDEQPAIGEIASRFGNSNFVGELIKYAGENTLDELNDHIERKVYLVPVSSTITHTPGDD